MIGVDFHETSLGLRFQITTWYGRHRYVIGTVTMCTSRVNGNTAMIKKPPSMWS
jgi:hypothetical protein